MRRHEAQAIIAGVNEAAVDGVARGLDAMNAVRGELIAFVEGKGVDS